jgi:hypothetical protein
MKGAARFFKTSTTLDMSPKQTEQLNRAQSAMWRMLYLFKLAHYEFEWLKSLPKDSAVRPILARGVQQYEKILTELRGVMSSPKSIATIREHMDASDEKIRTLSSIIERLSMCDEKQLEDFETELRKQVNVIYEPVG